MFSILSKNRSIMRSISKIRYIAKSPQKHILVDKFKSFLARNGLMKEKSPSQICNCNPKSAKTTDEVTSLAVIRALSVNITSTVCKLICAVLSGSSSILAECMHGLADCSSQFILLYGEIGSKNLPNRDYQFGYGKLSFIMNLLSGASTFIIGCCVSIFYGLYTINSLFVPVIFDKFLLLSLIVPFVLDGWALKKTLSQVSYIKKEGESLFQTIKNSRNTSLLTVVYEDIASCISVVLAVSGLLASHFTGVQLWDSLGSIAIGLLLGSVSGRVMYSNHRYLLGLSIGPELEEEITGIIRSYKLIDNVKDVKTQWNNPNSFSFQASVDLDGTYLAIILRDRYRFYFTDPKYRDNIDIYLSYYAEDITRIYEEELDKLKDIIRISYPEAGAINLLVGNITKKLRVFDTSLDEERAAHQNYLILKTKFDTLEFLKLRKRVNSFIPIQKIKENIINNYDIIEDDIDPTEIPPTSIDSQYDFSNYITDKMDFYDEIKINSPDSQSASSNNPENSVPHSNPNDISDDNH